MARTRTQKQIAKRIDIWYFRRPGYLRRLRGILAILCTLAVVLWIAIAAFMNDGQRGHWLDRVSMSSLHNPGHVAHAHAMFEKDCETCHTGEKPGQYTRAVTDQACLKCHDAAIHDQHQLIADDASKVSRKTMTLAVQDAAHPVVPMRSAGCISCHTEHRGEAELIGSANKNCVLCHANLNDARTVKSTNFANITSFAAGHHPRFGTFLKTPANKWSDPPKIKFNHQFHLEQTELKESANNCVLCHTTQPAQGVEDDAKLPPFANASESELTAAKTRDGAYMQPVSYAAHCANCHRLDVAELEGMQVRLPHTDLALVGLQLAGLTEQFRTKLAALSPEDRTAALTIEEGEGRNKKKHEIKEEDFAAKQLEPLKQKVNDWTGTPPFTDADDDHLPKSFKDAITQRVSGESPPDQLVLLTYAAFAMQNNCAKCHDMQIVSEKRGRNSPQPAAPPAISTAATGLTSQPHRWYTDSRFDHRPHRNIGCVDCHFATVASGAEAPLWNTKFARETGSADVLLPDIESCVACHKPGGESANAATDSCISCHVYHDRSKERAPIGTLSSISHEAPATQPTAAAISPNS